MLRDVLLWCGQKTGAIRCANYLFTLAEYQSTLAPLQSAGVNELVPSLSYAVFSECTIQFRIEISTGFLISS